MNIKMISAAISAVALALVAVPAGAATLLFSLTGDVTATWTAPESPVAPSFADEGFAIRVDGVIDGSPRTFDVNVYDLSEGGGMLLVIPFYDTILFDGVGPQVYSGSPASPTFLLGSYELTAFSVGDPGNGRLVISAIPEPASWAMMIAGFGIVGMAARRRGATLGAA